MKLSELQQMPHRRFNPLTREWLLVSPHRTERPWQGQVEALESVTLEYLADCYLCPGNQRAGGRVNPKYENVFVFENDFAALKPGDDEPSGAILGAGTLLQAERERGICKVLCFSPRHDLTLSRMEKADIRLVVDAWSQQFAELAAVPYIHYVQIFENRGAMMGASNPHPHCQIWASESIPNEPRKELDSMREYRKAQGRCLLCDYLDTEAHAQERVIVENKDFLVLVPFWAAWPFETLVLSKRHVQDMTELCADERDSLAEILKRLTTTYDRLFKTAFPYSMGFHQRPANFTKDAEGHFHGHFYPPLLRSATVRKFMVGFELLGSPQRDLTPETAAARLREAAEKI